MRHTPQHLMTSLTRRHVLQGTLGSVVGLASLAAGLAAQHRCRSAPRTPWADTGRSSKHGDDGPLGDQARVRGPGRGQAGLRVRAWVDM
jgi:hypothetical protein